MRPVTLLGAGNVAWHLAKAFHAQKIPVNGIWSRDPEHALSLASIVDSRAIAAPIDLSDDGSLVILAVPDHAISELVHQLIIRSWKHNLFVHTSGATSMGVLEGPFVNYGVFYPLQTLTKGHDTGPWPIPFLIQGNTSETTRQLEDYARILTPMVRTVDDDDRAKIHLAAVIINNFINHLGGRALEQLEPHALDKRLLEPLAQETVRKMFSHPPQEIQTGPAKRGDIPSIHKHLQMLADNPQLAALYRQISLSINHGLDI